MLVFAALAITSCGEKKKEAVLEFTLTYDELAHMCPPTTNVIKVDNAHSGQYVMQTDSLNVYSQTFIGTMGDVSKMAFSTITLTGFVKAKSTLSNGAMVVSIEDGQGNHFDYGSVTCKQTVKEIGVWTPFTLTVPLKKESMNPNNIVKIYGWNYDSKDATYFDDVTYTFN